MRYDNGIMIYSVGPDGVDDQGQPKDESAHSKQYDLTWVIEK